MAQRIISIVPSLTELLYNLDLNEEVVGITKFCIHPKHWFDSKPKIGGTKKLHIEAIKKLRPTLIIANKEENTKEDIEAIQQFTTVLLTTICTIEDAYKAIQQIGEAVNKSKKAAELTKAIQEQFATIYHTFTQQKVAYLIWRNPFMTVGNDTFIHHIITHIGLQNVFAHHTRYPTITITDLQHSNCLILLLSSEPYPFATKHIKELKAVLPNTKIILVDGEVFSWYGSRLLYTAAYIKKLQQRIISIT